jgi:hypothetical protein
MCLGEALVGNQGAGIIQVGALFEIVGADGNEGGGAQRSRNLEAGYPGLGICEGAAAVYVVDLKQAAWA